MECDVAAIVKIYLDRSTFSYIWFPYFKLLLDPSQIPLLVYFVQTVNIKIQIGQARALSNSAEGGAKGVH